MGNLMNSQTQNTQQNTAQNSATNANSATTYGTNTGGTSAQNTAQATNYAQGPSQAGASLINQATNPNNTLQNISAFQSPYTNQVLDAQVALENQRNALQQNQLQGNAAAQGALGGDRAAIAGAVLSGQQNLADAATNTGILQQGYNTALSAAQNTAAQQLQGAGLSGTAGSTATSGATTGATGQQTLGGVQSAQSQAQAQAGTGSGSSTTATNPGIATIAGLGLGLLSDERVKQNVRPIGKTFDGQTIHAFNYIGDGTTRLGLLAQEVEKHHPGAVHHLGGPDGLKTVDYDEATSDAARRKHFDAGGAVGSGQWVMQNGQMVWVPATAKAAAPDPNSPQAMYQLGQAANQTIGSLFNPNTPSASATTPSSAAATANPNSPMGMYQLGQQAHNYLSDTLFGTSSKPTTSDGGWNTSTQTSGLVGSGGLGNTLSNIGTSLGLASGGSTSAAPVTVSAPPATAPAALAPMPYSSFYTPVSAPVAQAATPALTPVTAAAPSIAMPTVQQAAMPSVSFPWVPQASSGKGSGGAVRGFDDGGPVSDGSQDPGIWGAVKDYVRNNPEAISSLGPIGAGLAGRALGYGAGEASAATPKAPETPAALGTSDIPKSALYQPSASDNLYGSPVSAAYQTAVAPQSLGQGTTPPVAGASEKPATAVAQLGTAPISISGRLETGQSDPMKGLPNVSTDTGGSRSYGNYGLNSLPGSSAWHFQRDYGQALGLTAQPGTPEFDAQWRAIASDPKTAGALRQAEQDWYQKNIGANVASSLTRVGVSPEIASDPRVQSYFGDRMVQQGAYSTLNHANRVEGAFQASGGDPVKFLQNMSALDKDPQNLSRDFRTYLGEHPDRVRGLENRVDGRLQAALGGAQAPAEASSSGSTTGLGRLYNRVFGEGVGEKDRAPVPLSGTRPGGGLLSLAGVPMSENTQNSLASIARVLASTGQGQLAQGLQFEPKLGMEQTHIGLEQQKLAKELATPHQIGSVQTQYVDQFGIPHVNLVPQYGVYDPASKKFVPTPVPGGVPGQTAGAAPSGYAALGDISPGVSGDDFVKAAKKAGINSNDLETAQRVADYKIDLNKIAGLKEMERRRIELLAHRINPDYTTEQYAAASDTTKKLASGDVAKAVRSIGRLFDEVEQAKSLADQTGNTRSENFNALSSHLYPSGSHYGQAAAKLGTALNNVTDTAAAVAKGGGQGAEGDARRRGEQMNIHQATPTLKGALDTEAEIALKNGQSNLSSYNTAHGYKPDNPKYQSIMDHLTPAQQQKAVEMLGAAKIEEITGKPVPEFSGSNATGRSNIPDAAISFLRQHPELRSDFDTKYGAGSSARVLGQ